MIRKLKCFYCPYEIEISYTGNIVDNNIEIRCPDCNNIMLEVEDEVLGDNVPIIPELTEIEEGRILQEELKPITKDDIINLKIDLNRQKNTTK